jgi:hypothetical protein
MLLSHFYLSSNCHLDCFQIDFSLKFTVISGRIAALYLWNGCTLVSYLIVCFLQVNQFFSFVSFLYLFNGFYLFYFLQIAGYGEILFIDGNFSCCYVCRTSSLARPTSYNSIIPRRFWTALCLLALWVSA